MIRKLVVVILLGLIVCTAAFAVELPIEPHTMSEFETIWDYVVINDADLVEIHYSEKQSVNTYHKYEN